MNKKYWCQAKLTLLTLILDHKTYLMQWNRLDLSFLQITINSQSSIKMCRKKSRRGRKERSRCKKWVLEKQGLIRIQLLMIFGMILIWFLLLLSWMMTKREGSNSKLRHNQTITITPTNMNIVMLREQLIHSQSIIHLEKRINTTLENTVKMRSNSLKQVLTRMIILNQFRDSLSMRKVRNRQLQRKKKIS